jgi:hypothetical protein
MQHPPKPIGSSEPPEEFTRQWITLPGASGYWRLVCRECLKKHISELFPAQYDATRDNSDPELVCRHHPRAVLSSPDPPKDEGELQPGRYPLNPQDPPPPGG